MIVRATAKGTYPAGHLRQVGEEFEVPAKTKASWFEPVKTKKAAPAKTESEQKTEQKAESSSSDA